jgi:hypothetical protein
LQGPGCLAVAQLLEVPQGQDLAVQRIHGIEGGLDADLPLGAGGRFTGLGQVAQQPRRQGRAGGLGQGAVIEPDLPARVPRPQVAAVQERQALADDEPQPEEEGEVGFAAVLRQAGHGLDVGVLDHVGGIDPALEPAVQTQGDHPPQPVAVAVEQGPPRLRVTRCGTAEQPAHLAGIVGRCVGHAV